MSAKEHNTAPVFLLSPGRSGSTLLQRHLNSSPGLILWGEHGGFLKGIRKTYQEWVENDHHQYLLSQGKIHSDLLLSSKVIIGVDIEWTNNFTREDFRKRLAIMIRDLFTIDVPDLVRWGFKEIRYGKEDIYFLKELFPSSQIIFIVRDPIDTLASAIVALAKGQPLWESEQTDENYKQIKEQLQMWTRRIGDVARDISVCMKNNLGHLIKYEELIKDPHAIINKLCRVLEIPPPTVEQTNLIAGDVRQGMNTTIVRGRLTSEFLGENCVQDLLDIYKSMGYDRRT